MFPGFRMEVVKTLPGDGQWPENYPLATLRKGDEERDAGPQATTGPGGGALNDPQHDAAVEHPDQWVMGAVRDALVAACPETARPPSGLQPPYRKVRSKELHAMSTATVTSKGQITIPAEVRQALQVKAGDRVEFVQIEPGRFEVVAATRPVTDLKGLFGRPSKAVSIDDMNKAIAARGASAR